MVTPWNGGKNQEKPQQVKRGLNLAFRLSDICDQDWLSGAPTRAKPLMCSTLIRECFMNCFNPRGEALAVPV
jgi:hypothetical protein